MHNPIVGYVTSEFTVNRRHPVTGVLLPHWGIDIASGKGNAEVRAAYGGRVFRAGWGVFPHRSGNQVGIVNPDGEIQIYCHLSRISVKVGQQVKAGQVIGREGATGNVTGPHLHFECHYATSSAANGFARVRNPRLDFNAAGLKPGVGGKKVIATSGSKRRSGIVYTNRRNAPIYMGTGKRAKLDPEQPTAQNYKLARIGVKGKGGSWTQIMWKGKRRWIKTAHVSPKKTPVIMFTSRRNAEIYINRGANKKLDPLQPVAKGYALAVVKVAGSWTQVRWQGNNRWIPSSQLSHTR